MQTRLDSAICAAKFTQRRIWVLTKIERSLAYTTVLIEGIVMFFLTKKISGGRQPVPQTVAMQKLLAKQRCRDGADGRIIIVCAITAMWHCSMCLGRTQVFNFRSPLRGAEYNIKKNICIHYILCVSIHAQAKHWSHAWCKRVFSQLLSCTEGFQSLKRSEPNMKEAGKGKKIIKKITSGSSCFKSSINLVNSSTV